MFGDHGLPQALGRQQNHVLALGHTLEGQDAFDAGAMDLFGPGPLKVGHRLKPADPGLFQPPFDALPGAGVEFAPSHGVEEGHRTPALLRGPRHEIVEIGRGLREAQLAELLRQRRRDRIG
jgi:hypothetical protein